jgi:hypothetical protein
LKQKKRSWIYRTTDRQGEERDVLDVLEVMTTEEHQIDEDEEVVDVQGFAAFFGVSWTSVCVEAAVKVVLSDVGAWKMEESLRLLKREGKTVEYLAWPW